MGDYLLTLGIGVTLRRLAWNPSVSERQLELNGGNKA
jgi:hypothetical protein